MADDQTPMSFGELFELPDDVTYLDGAGRSPLLKSCRILGQEAVMSKTHPWQMKDEQPLLQKVRGAFARLVGAASPDDIAIMPSTSYAISTAARNIPMAEGQYALVLEQQMASNVLPWQDLCRRCKGELL
eukprot:4918975-Pyramimonas_sp.AAC.2